MAKKKRAKGAGPKHKFKGNEKTTVIGIRVPESKKQKLKPEIMNAVKPIIDPYLA